jgi:hypothetical protein
LLAYLLLYNSSIVEDAQARADAAIKEALGIA